LLQLIYAFFNRKTHLDLVDIDKVFFFFQINFHQLFGILTPATDADGREDGCCATETGQKSKEQACTVAQTSEDMYVDKTMVEPETATLV